MNEVILEFKVCLFSTRFNYPEGLVYTRHQSFSFFLMLMWSIEEPLYRIVVLSIAQLDACIITFPHETRMPSLCFPLHRYKTWISITNPFLLFNIQTCYNVKLNNETCHIHCNLTTKSFENILYSVESIRFINFQFRLINLNFSLVHVMSITIM